MDLGNFREQGRDGLRFDGRRFHLHRFLISEVDIEHWLKGSSPPADAGEKVIEHAAEVKNPPFDETEAMRLLLFKKLSHEWPAPPTEKESRAFLLQHFSGVPNDPHRKIRREVWRNQIKPGPRSTRRTAE